MIQGTGWVPDKYKHLINSKYLFIYVPQEQGVTAEDVGRNSRTYLLHQSRCGLTVPMGGLRPFPGQRSTIGP
jgi:hypothetical protein